MPAELRDFYDTTRASMEPWDGPAALAFTDGRVIGATLDRNGLRPGRWRLTRDGFVVLASETGVLPVGDPADVVGQGSARSRARSSWSTSRADASSTTAGEGRGRRAPAVRPLVRRAAPSTSTTSPMSPRAELPGDPLRTRQLAFGYTDEDLRILLAAWPGRGRGAHRLDGHRHPAGGAVRSRPPLLFTYFKQLFAQVTNPPIDPIREKIVMSARPLRRAARATCSTRRPSTPASCSTRSPLLTDRASSRSCAQARPARASARTPWTPPGRVSEGAGGPRSARSTRSAAEASRPRSTAATTS